MDLEIFQALKTRFEEPIKRSLGYGVGSKSNEVVPKTAEKRGFRLNGETHQP
jgi:hypothetical protein